MKEILNKIRTPNREIKLKNKVINTWNSTWIGVHDIEYTRTDALIEKVDEFISTFFHPDDTELIDAVLNRFHEHIKLK